MRERATDRQTERTYQQKENKIKETKKKEYIYTVIQILKIKRNKTKKKQLPISVSHP